MIGHAHDAEPRSYSGVEFDVLASGTQSMVTKMKYRNDNEVPPHSHPNSQSGYVLSGRYRLMIDGDEDVIGPGDSYSIPADVVHSIEVLEAGEVIDVFVPPRADYL